MSAEFDLAMDPRNRAPAPAANKSSFVLKEFQAQKDKSTNNAVVTLRPGMYALASNDDKEAQLKKDTIGLVQHDDFKRLKAEIEHNREKTISPVLDPTYPSLVVCG